MGTASTKSRARKQKQARKELRKEEGAQAAVGGRQIRQPEMFMHGSTGAGDFPAWLWPVASALILIAAAALRLYGYALKPFHHDEGVNGFFLINLFRNHVYHYDPSNYHGPTLYYFSLLTSLIFGLNDFAVRLVPAIFGVATVWLMLLLRRYIGTIGALTAAAFVAVSPCAVFYSRYFIHESLFVFFSAAIVLAALKYYETVNPLYLMLLAVAAALLFATKETALITAAVFIIALVSAEVYQRMRRTRGGAAASGWGSRKSRKQKGFTRQPEPKRGIEATLARFGEPSDLVWLALSALALFALVHVL
ncbi:MAG TPA: flippase activity-associated protein Agl23, partial [Pyrinomonadaceae bacterium]|nr:flippase activity-associated protein Agl23 [Pyrinomonadaceae bacterium]